jgi:UDP-N-acetylmuramate dehydrogenase
VQVESKVMLAPLTTLRLGGPAANLVEAGGAAEIIDAVLAAQRSADPVLLLAGGSNLVIADAGFGGTVVLVRSRGLRTERRGDLVEVTVEAGHNWDDLVEYTVDEGLAGLECMSGIPGSAGATPIQNVGAYGQEVSDTIRSVTVLDRLSGDVRVLGAGECGFAYRNSAFRGSDRYVLLDVTFALRPGRSSTALRYGELSRVLGVEAGGSAPLGDVRDAVLALRRGKGMVIDDGDPDTRSVGSFFTNPVLDPDAWSDLCERTDEEPPHWPEADGRVKISAAWLIERAGFAKGYGRDGVAISSKHTLALTHRGGGSTSALLGLAREIRDGVRARFGIGLVNEPILIGDQL